MVEPLGVLAQRLGTIALHVVEDRLHQFGGFVGAHLGARHRGEHFGTGQGEAEDERPVIVALPLHALQRDRLEQLGSILSNHPGYCEVKLAVFDDNGNARVGRRGR